MTGQEHSCMFILKQLFSTYYTFKKIIIVIITQHEEKKHKSFFMLHNEKVY